MNSAKAGALCPQAIFEFADLTLDARQCAVFRDGVRLPLPKLTYELLLALVETAPALLTHDELAERVWRGRLVDRKSVVSGKSVSVRVDLGGRRIFKKKTHTKTSQNNQI